MQQIPKVRAVLAAIPFAVALAALVHTPSSAQQGVAGARNKAPAAAAGVDVATNLSVNQFTVQDLGIATLDEGSQLIVDVSLDGQPQRLTVQSYSLRSTRFEVLEQRADGGLQAVAAPPVRTFRGVVDGHPESLVALSLDDAGSLTGAIRLGQSAWGLQPLRDVDATAAPARHVVYRAEDVHVPDALCGTVENVDPIGEGGEEGGIAGGGLTGGVQADIAFDADFEFFQQNGSSTPNTVADIEGVLNGIEAMYHRDVGIAYRITTIIVRSNVNDPYNQSNAGAQLDQFRNYWNANHGSVVRDLAQLMTGRNFSPTIGIAYLGTICTSPSNAYSMAQSRFSTNFGARISVSAHEIGHNFTAQHCDGAADCGMMCSGVGGCSGNFLLFGAGASSQIIARRNACGGLLVPLGACCVGTTCTQVSSAECATAGGTWTANTPCTTRTNYTANPNVAIPDNNAGGVTTTMTVNDNFVISDLNLRLNIPHTWIGDLIVDISHNGGPFVRVIDRMGLPPGSEGCGSDNLNVWLDDEGFGGSIEAVCSSGAPGADAPSSGPSFRPNNMLTAFNGQNASGTWTLRAFDFFPADTGTIASWTLNIESASGNFCQPTGACCVGSNCTQTTQPACAASGGVWTLGQACTVGGQNFCAPLGACCQGPNCLQTTQTVCNNSGGVWTQGQPCTVGGKNFCAPVGACCVGANCSQLTQSACNNAGGVWAPGACNAESCAPLGSCCVGTSCTQATQSACSNAGGEWTQGAPCDANACPAPCAPDISPAGGNGTVDVDDLLAVITSWGPCPNPPAPCPANIVTTGGSATSVDVDDLLAVITAWGDCP